MIPTLLLVIALSANVNCGPLRTTTTIPEVKELSTSSLQYVYAFFRHGIRSPLYEPYPTDINMDKFHQIFKGPKGTLTKAGKQEMYEVGKRLSEIYGTFINGYSDSKVYASSTETARTIMTALSVMAALFPPKEPLFKDLEKWQPVPIWQDTRQFDKVYFYNDHDFPALAHKECPRYGEMIQKGYDIVLAKDKTKSRQEIYRLLREKTGDPKIDSIDKAYSIYDILEMENLNGLPLPEWATELQPTLGNKPLYPDLMRPLQVDWFFKTQWLQRNNEMLSFYSGPLFYNINEKFQNKKDNKGDKERFRYHNTHDDTILTLRWALGFDDPKFEVEAGDGIAFELHNVDNEHYVQVVYYHSLRKTEEFGEVLHLPKCPFPCSYENFSKLYPGISPKHWELKCEVSEVPSITLANGK